jgi:Zn ribbon nucleic-acid-binding protein
MPEHDLSKLEAAMLKKFPKGLKCPACQRSLTEGVSVAPFTSMPADLKKDKKGPKWESMPALTMICGNCGYYMHFEPKRLGIA